MQQFTLNPKAFFLTLSFIFIGTSFGFAQKIIYTGKTITFEKQDYATFTLAANQDRITDSVWITRQNDRGIYNIKVESSYTNSSSPSGTKWAFGKTSNLSSLTFSDWETTVGSNPPGMVNRDMVLMIEKDSIYIDIKFTSWTQGGAGGGFEYDRSTDCRDFDTISKTTCDSFVSPSKKYVWKKSGTYYDTLTNAASCDSIIMIKLHAYTQDTGTLFRSGCGMATLPVSGDTVTKTGTYYETIKGGTICKRDSVVETKVFIFTVPKVNMKLTGCDSVVSPSGLHVWNKSGTYTDVLTAVGSCDTIATVEVTINETKTTNITETACDAYTSATSKVYTTSGIYTDTLSTSTGCDSLIVLDLTVNESQFKRIFPTECKVAYTSPSGKYMWDTDGTYMDTIPTMAGCDSVIEIRLTMATPKSDIKISSCEPWISPSGKYTFSVSGDYIDTLSGAKSCDSLVNINFTRLESSTANVTIPVAINKFHAPSGKYVWNANGSYKDTIPNVQGCDSFITFDVTVENVTMDVTNDDVKLVAQATGYNYQWLDCDDDYAIIVNERFQSFRPSKKGRYAVEISNQWSRDTSDCFEVNLSLEDINPYNITVYPNPNSGQFSVDLREVYNQVLYIELYTTTGRVVQHITDIQPVTHMNLSNDMESGLYLVRIVSDDFSYSTPLLVK